MSFNSSSFICFFILVAAFQALPLSWRVKKTGFLLASYVFYSAWNPPFALLLCFSTLVDWQAARWMARFANRKKFFLALSLFVNLGLLFFFKYGNFALSNIASALNLSGYDFSAPRMDIVLPLGISFYTFQTLSYIIDVYRGSIRPCDSLLDYALYVTFFPQLVSGPIVRAGEFLPQCESPRKTSPDKFFWGAALFAFGLFQKEILADCLMSPISEKTFGGGDLGFIDAWAGTLAFSCQIFFDFAGYSSCAAGVALCLGFSLPANFRRPYGAAGFSDFWRRWHMSLSSWFRDYVYIPLGGGARGEQRAWANAIFTMMVCGLWHGASWTFVAWGGIHGALLAIERAARRILHRENEGGLFSAAATFIVVSIAWVFFRADSMSGAAAVLAAMFSPGRSSFSLGSTQIYTAFATAAALFATHRILRDKYDERLIEKIPWWAVGLGLSAMIALIIMAPGDDRAFIYFQF